MAEKKQTFEESLAELETISDMLENGDLDLDGMIKAFERGIKLSKQCSETLEKAKQKIEKLNSDISGD